jgi:hypothetical protein
MGPVVLAIMSSLVGVGYPDRVAQPVGIAVELTRTVARDVRAVVPIQVMIVSMDHASMAVRSRSSGKHTP